MKLRYLVFVTLVALASMFLITQAEPSAFNGQVICIVGEESAGPCTTPDNGDEMDEGFIDTGYELGVAWAETLNGGTIDEDFSLTGSPGDNSCDEGLQVATPTAGNAYATWNRGSAISADTPYVEHFEFQITDLTMDIWSSIKFSASGGNVTPSVSHNASLELYQAGEGTYTLKGYGTGSSDGATISLDTWIIAELTHYATAASSTFQCISGCGDSDTHTFTRGANDIQYLTLGTMDGVGAGEQVTIEWGYVYVNTP